MAVRPRLLGPEPRPAVRRRRLAAHRTQGRPGARLPDVLGLPGLLRLTCPGTPKAQAPRRRRVGLRHGCACWPPGNPAAPGGVIDRFDALWARRRSPRRSPPPEAPRAPSTRPLPAPPSIAVPDHSSITPERLIPCPRVPFPASGDVLELDLQQVEVVVCRRRVHASLDEAVAELVRVGNVAESRR
jgi:hypothetical protein